MPKGKPKAKFAGLYEDEETPQPRSTAPQAAAHKRGGTHRVKEGDVTNTKYDAWNYKQLKNEAIDRGVYIKDMKKAEMAQVLKKYDENSQRVERAAVIEQERRKMLREQEHQKERERKHKAAVLKMKRKIEKEKARQRDESVSDDTLDEDDLRMMHNELMGVNENGGVEIVGHIVSDNESWDSTSSGDEDLSTSTMVHSARLRLFEWPWPDVPPEPAAIDPQLPFGIPHKERPERKPRLVHYAPLKVHTTSTADKLYLPGQTYPPGIERDFVPLLSQDIRSAAHNGILQGTLRKATIERASDWAKRTYVNPQDASLFFVLPPNNGDRSLHAVYDKWYLESQKLLRVHPSSNRQKADRKRRHAQRVINKARKVAEVYETCEYKPPGMIYLPAYLDLNDDVEHEDYEDYKSLENLFYIRFPGCDVPHYYFWARKDRWEDPTIPNPHWDPMSIDTEVPRPTATIPASHPKISTKNLTRIKKSNVNFPPPPDAASQTATLILKIDRLLYAHGLAAILSHYRDKWQDGDKWYAWRDFSSRMPRLHPGGLPDVPPVRPTVQTSVSAKLAHIELLGDVLLPAYNGCEPWTSNDDGYWDVAEVPKEEEMAALYRRTSLLEPSPAERKHTACLAWLEDVEPSFAPREPDDEPDEVVGDNMQHWEQRGMNVQCPFCLEDLSSSTLNKQAEHIHSHSAVRALPPLRPQLMDWPLVALQASARGPSCFLSASRTEPEYDSGYDADTERLPSDTQKGFPRRFLNLLTTKEVPYYGNSDEGEQSASGRLHMNELGVGLESNICSLNKTNRKRKLNPGFCDPGAIPQKRARVCERLGSHLVR